MTASSPTKLPSSLESDENIIDSTGVSNYNHLIEELSGFFDTNPFSRRTIKISIDKDEKLNKKLRNTSIRIKQVEYYHPFAFVTVMSESVIHSRMSSLVGHQIERALDHAFPQEEYFNFGNAAIDSPQRKKMPDAQLYPQVREEREEFPTVVVEVGVNECKRDLLRDISDYFTIERGNFVIEAAIISKIKLGSRDEAGGPGLLSKKFTGAIFESYLRVVRADVTRDGRGEGWIDMVQRETIEATVICNGGAFDHVALNPIGIELSAMGRGRNGQRNGGHHAITLPGHLCSPDAQNNDDVVLLSEDDIIQITRKVFLAHESQVARAAGN